MMERWTLDELQALPFEDRDLGTARTVGELIVALSALPPDLVWYPWDDGTLMVHVADDELCGDEWAIRCGQD